MKKLLQSTLLGITFSSGIALANIPEPDVVFYGKVSVKLGANKVGLHQGDLSWVIKHRESGKDEQYSFSTKLESLADGKYSYKIKIPQQLLVDIDTLASQPQGSFLTQSKKELLLKHYQISVNGEQVLLDDVGLSAFTAGEVLRSNHQRLDLTMSGDSLVDLNDEDGDGLPNIWEQHYGLQVDVNDAAADEDGDGWSNEEEYGQGTNPILDNRKPLLSGENGSTDAPMITLYENGLVQLRLSINDSDSNPEDLSVSLDSIPEDLQVLHVDDMSQALVEGDVLYAADVTSGKLFGLYKPASLFDEEGRLLELGNLKLSIHDGGPLHKSTADKEEPSGEEDPLTEEEPFTEEEPLIEEKLLNEPQIASIKLNIFRPSDIADPVRWIDGMTYRGQSVTKLSGRSGSELDMLSAYDYTKVNRAFKETGAEINVSDEGMIGLESGMLAFSEPEDTDDRLDLSGNRSLFAVYQSQAESNSSKDKFFNDGRIELAENEARFTFGKASSRKHVASMVSFEEGLRIAAVHTQQSGSYLEYDGIQVGGPVELESDATHEASSLAGFGFATGAWGANDGYVEAFGGEVGEFIAFPRTVEGKDKWAVNAFLLSKWKGYSVIDASRSATAVKLLADPALTKPVVMLGGIANDTLTSNDNGEASVLFGGAGQDTLIGGIGSDRFIVTDGDTIEGFKEYSASPIEDVIDVSELLPRGSGSLENCLFFAPVGNNTKVDVNAECAGQDLVSGSDFTDATFTIIGQGLWNTDIPVLWRNGALFAGSHRPGKLQAGLGAGSESQEIKVSENDGNGGELRVPIHVSFQGGNAFIGKNSFLPLVIRGSDLEGGDFDLTTRMTLEEDQTLIDRITLGEYSTIDDLLSLTTEQLKDFRIERDEYGNLSYTHSLLADAIDSNGSLIVHLPTRLIEDAEAGSQIALNLIIAQDSEKESEETITFQLGQVPEYYDLLPDRDKLTVTISDGLDKVFVTNPVSIIAEGQQGQFTLNRTGSIDQPLVVDVSLSGLATNGEDYSGISSQLTFAKGESTLIVPVHSLLDDSSEPTEIAELRVLSSSRYDIDATRNLAQLYIQDEALNFIDTDKDGLPDTWELANGLNHTISNQGVTGPQDADNDGLSDLDEYHLGTNPMKADSDGDGVSDGQDPDPSDAEVKDANEIKGYQLVKLGYGDAVNVPVGLDRVIEVPLEYLTSDGSDMSSGLQLVLQYNADQLEFIGMDGVLPASLASTGNPEPKAVNRGGYKLFTHQIPVTWDSVANDWPGMPLPVKLLKARFKVVVSAAVGQQFMIGIDASSAADGYVFKPKHLAVNVVSPAAMDIIVNKLDESKEALMLARHFAGLSPEVPSEEVSSKMAGSEVDRIRKHIGSVGVQYDVDGDGVANPLTDAVLIYHYLNNDDETKALTQEKINEILGKNTTVKLADVERRIREIQELQQ